MCCENKTTSANKWFAGETEHCCGRDSISCMTNLLINLFRDFFNSWFYRFKKFKQISWRKDDFMEGQDKEGTPDTGSCSTACKLQEQIYRIFNITVKKLWWFKMTKVLNQKGNQTHYTNSLFISGTKKQQTKRRKEGERQQTMIPASSQVHPDPRLIASRQSCSGPRPCRTAGLLPLDKQQQQQVKATQAATVTGWDAGHGGSMEGRTCLCSAAMCLFNQYIEFHLWDNAAPSRWLIHCLPLSPPPSPCLRKRKQQVKRSEWRWNKRRNIHPTPPHSLFFKRFSLAVSRCIQ